MAALGDTIAASIADDKFWRLQSASAAGKCKDDE
jgi:hypothetical protein